MSRDVRLERFIPLVVELKGDGEQTCIVCGHLLRRSRQIHIIDGGAAVAHPDYEYPYSEADLGWYSIGPECARMFPSYWMLTATELDRRQKAATQ